MPKLSLYHSQFCFFCHKVRQMLPSLSFDVELRNVGQREHNQELLKGGGKTQVPCLRIENGDQVKWMYESDDIIRYLRSL